ncbi:primosomal protein N' [Streptococcus cuniculipharyngis]|uniref:Replication restart protein PriA n=1 Tax=Streptococcus cuniculipharyngis TaxID=1562651 RepID=A0A5C5SCT6_9STRE|nr:primosomal protein N' [Streptococcus cuniculipharyngis]TWS98102.1 primosomal protein N' [Streptococcus cuniculipharyngis]
MTVARIIVDIPSMQTDKPYSYRVPQALLSLVAVGSRVHVPFGRSNRLLQGFVVELVEEDLPSLKEVAAVLDLEPVLNQEQLDLVNQMRKTVFSYKITLLKAMLPNLLTSDYDRLLRPNQALDPTDRLAIFGQAEQVLWSQLPAEVEGQVVSLVKAGLIDLAYIAKDKKTIKRLKSYKVDAAYLAELVIAPRAKKRLLLREYLLAHPQGLLSDLYQTFSRDQVHYFRELGVLFLEETEVNRSQLYFEGVTKSERLTLNDEQAEVLEQLKDKIGQRSVPVLLQGVTGSGKTEVYLQLIDQVLTLGKTAIVLVPEISLTPQMSRRFIARFGQQVAMLHSSLSDGEKFDEWRRIKTGQARVVVGARSAIFAPLENIGAIIIDEEHESSYKQESNPRYHARDVAVLRANYHQAVLVLGSATPSIESRARASRGVYDRLSLTQRANPAASLPQIELVDFRDYLGQQAVSNFTPRLLEKIQNRLDKGEQVVLMLNRRGYSSFVMCRECGAVDQCPNCDISLTLHMTTRSMNCHYCGFQKGIPQICSNCRSSTIRYYGTGTQKAYDELLQVFPQARILRMDVDTTRKKGAHQAILERFGRQEADILLGTQMIAKGLDFPNVTLVGVLNADTAIHLPDFRSAERTFQLLTQVAGRAGRAAKAGEVIIQTYNPQNYAIQFAKNQDYEGFYAYEMPLRQRLAYPPYYYTVGLSLSHAQEEVVMKQAYEILDLLRQYLSPQAKILGPVPKPIARTHNLYHYQIIVKYRFEAGLETVLNHILALSQSPEQKGLRLSIDSEPQHFL